MKRLWKAQGKEKINKTLWGKMCGHSEGPRKADYLIVAGAGGGVQYVKVFVLRRSWKSSSIHSLLLWKVVDGDKGRMENGGSTPGGLTKHRINP